MAAWRSASMRAGNGSVSRTRGTACLASERSNAVRNFVRDWCAEQGLSAYDRRRRGGFLRNLVVREGRRTGDLQVRLVTGEGQFASDAFAGAMCDRFGDVGVMWTQTSATAEVSHGGDDQRPRGARHIWRRRSRACASGSPRRRSSRPTPRWRRGSTSLRPSTPASDGHERVFDIYCGIGTLSLLLALRSAEVWGVDIAEQAIANAIENARLNEIDNARFFAGDARTALRPLAGSKRHRPGRRGGRPPARRPLAEGRPPAARDTAATHRLRLLQSDDPRPNARQMVDAGFGLVKVRPVDMFPHTPHIECVALLERTSADEQRRRGLRRRCRARPWRHARPRQPNARPSDTGRCGRTTIRWRAASRRSRSLPCAAPELEVGVAVLALDRHTPADIAARSSRRSGSIRRVCGLGIGAGFTKRPLGVVREGLAAVRAAVPGETRVAVAAMGPKMCALAGAEADGVFLNWMTPEKVCGACERVTRAPPMRGETRRP